MAHRLLWSIANSMEHRIAGVTAAPWRLRIINGTPLIQENSATVVRDRGLRAYRLDARGCRGTDGNRVEGSLPKVQSAITVVGLSGSF